MFRKYASMVCLLLLFVLALSVAAEEPCYGDPECYDDPPPAPPESGGETAPPWEGFSDGRLNPDMAEYYSVWCAYDGIEVWRAMPEPFRVKAIPILDVIGLAEGAALDLGDNMSLVRNTADTITIYGSNGNLAPQPGQKAFSLSECIARNGGLPDEPSESNAQPLESSGTESTGTDWVDICLSLESPDDILDCLWSSPNLSGIQILWLWISQYCLGGIGAVLVIPGGIGLLFKRQRRRRAR